MPENRSSAELTPVFLSVLISGMGWFVSRISIRHGFYSLYYQAGAWADLGPRLQGAGWTDTTDAVTVSPCFP